MMRLSSKIVDFQMRMPGTKVLSWGYNNSPWNYGEVEEASGGLQSITTKHHLQIWNRPPDDMYAPLSAISAPAREFIEGDSSTKIAGRLIQNQLEILASPFINMDSIHVDRRGLHARLDTTLSTALKTPGFFTDFIKPLHYRIEQATIALGRALTDKDFAYVRHIMQSNYELGNNTIYPDLQEAPRLIQSVDERRVNIEGLREAGYPQDVVDRLQKINSRLKNRDEVPERNWVRNGFGYALVITQDMEEQNAEIHIRPAVLIRSSRGGVVETQGIALQRNTNTQESDAIVKENVENVKELQKYLNEASKERVAA